MLSNRLAFAALAIACIGAAAGGGYLASRQNAMPTPASAQVQSVAPAAASPAAAVQAERPVQETEAVVGDTTPKTAAPVATARTTVAKRAEAPARSVNTRESRRAAAPQTPAPAPTPTLTSTWPSGAASQPPAPAPATVEATPAPRPDERAATESQRPPEAPPRTFEELVVSADSVIGLQTETRLSSETARLEDRVDARDAVRQSGRPRRDSRGVTSNWIGDAGGARRQVQGACAPRHPFPHARARGWDACADHH